MGLLREPEPEREEREGGEEAAAGRSRCELVVDPDGVESALGAMDLRVAGEALRQRCAALRCAVA